MTLSRLPNCLMASLWLGLAACGRAGAPRVFFTEPMDGAVMSSPVHIDMDSENFIIEPAGQFKSGAGHLHIMVDTGCIPAGQEIPRDESHLHFGDGQTSADLELAPGTHSLCLQAGDGVHIALEGEGMQDEITIQVSG